MLSLVNDLFAMQIKLPVHMAMEEWAYALDLPKWSPQRVFVQEVLEREVRLSYWDKVKQVIIHAGTRS